MFSFSLPFGHILYQYHILRWLICPFKSVCADCKNTLWKYTHSHDTYLLTDSFFFFGDNAVNVHGHISGAWQLPSVTMFFYCCTQQTSDWTKQGLCLISGYWTDASPFLQTWYYQSCVQILLICCVFKQQTRINGEGSGRWIFELHPINKMMLWTKNRKYWTNKLFGPTQLSAYIYSSVTVNHSDMTTLKFHLSFKGKWELPQLKATEINIFNRIKYHQNKCTANQGKCVLLLHCDSDKYFCII